MTETVTTSDGIELKVHVAGTERAPPLLFANSLGTDHAMWAPQVEQLAGKFHIVTYDSRGHGSSDAPQGDYSIERLGLDVLDIADRMGWSDFNMAGVSLGGMLGLWIAQHHPQRLRRVIVANAAPYANGPAGWTERMATVREKGLQAIVDAVVSRWFTPAFAASHPELVNPMKEHFLAIPAHGYLGSCAALANMDLRPLLAKISTPLLWIAGSQDALPPIEVVKSHAATVPSGSFLTLPAAHLSNLEAASDFSIAVETFFL